ncbi:S8 family serine peptidase [Thermomonospora amylolytica]|uniref:S8 family serine peptidase n=1 Tax=Thermomonospora amylolytica TaxID=1411117 RepID=UPI001300B0DC|nr:S8 family serine peptidase [Thermomonospora amylolytica]
MIVSAMAMLLLGATAAPGVAATATRPLPGQWWFTTWAIEGHLWPHSKGAGVTVAVLDTGVEASLPDLAGAVLPGADFQWGSGDGRVDQDNENRGHGTGMATAIAARGTHTGFFGVAPEAKILPVITKDQVAIAKGIRFAADRGAKVINISQGAPAPCPDDLQQAVRYAIERDVVVVAAAGNDGEGANQSEFPANCKGVLAVGASTVDNGPWNESQRQPYVDVAAPGANIVGLLKEGKVLSSSGGTSTAAALTSGAIALIRSKYPQMTNREVVRQVVASAKDIGAPGRDDASGHGIWRPRLIFSGEVPKNTGNPVFEEYDQWAKSASTGSGGQGQQPQNGQEKPGGEESGGGSTDLIVYGAIGGVALLIIVGGFFMTRRRNRGPASPVFAPAQEPVMMSPGMAQGPMQPHPGQMAGPPPSMGTGPMPPQAPYQPNAGQPQYQPPQQYGPPPAYGPPPSMGSGPAQPPGDAPPGPGQAPPPQQH